MMSPLPNAKTRMVPVKEVSSYFRQALLRPLLASLAEIPPPGVDESLRNHHFGGGSPCHLCLLHLERGGVNGNVTVTHPARASYVTRVVGGGRALISTFLDN